MRTQTQNEVSLRIARFGVATITVEVPAETTLAESLRLAGITLASTETVRVDGNQVDLNSIVEDGDEVSIVGNKAGGLL